MSSQCEQQVRGKDGDKRNLRFGRDPVVESIVFRLWGVVVDIDQDVGTIAAAAGQCGEESGNVVAVGGEHFVGLAFIHAREFNVAQVGLVASELSVDVLRGNLFERGNG